MVPDDTERDEGVDFAEIEPVLEEEVSYPITSEELVERYGDRELGRTNADPISLRELFEFMGEDTFESPDDVHQMIMSQMPRESVGRSNYSDRGGATPMETDEAEAAEEQTAEDLEGGPATDSDVDADGERREEADGEDDGDDGTDD